MFRVFLSFLVVMLFCATQAQAGSKSVEKLGRGVTNIITAPIEIPKQVRAYWIEGAQKTDHILVWIASGIVWGKVQGVKRFSSGVWDTLTFAIEKPDEYEPLMKPDFVFEEWPRNPVSGY